MACFGDRGYAANALVEEVCTDRSSHELGIIPKFHSSSYGDLIAEHCAFDAKIVRGRLATIPAWSPKLGKPNFCEPFVTQALEALLRLRIIDTTTGEVG